MAEEKVATAHTVEGVEEQVVVQRTQHHCHGIGVPTSFEAMVVLVSVFRILATMSMLEEVGLVLTDGIKAGYHHMVVEKKCLRMDRHILVVVVLVGVILKIQDMMNFQRLVETVGLARSYYGLPSQYVPHALQGHSLTKKKPLLHANYVDWEPLHQDREIRSALRVNLDHSPRRSVARLVKSVHRVNILLQPKTESLHALALQ
jgi:hypothetical protein